jgi:hypothetical protein
LRNKDVNSVSIEGSNARFDFPLQNLFEDNDKLYGSDGNTKTYFIISFKSKQVSISSYLLRSHSSGWANGCFISNWEFEGSNDKVNWISIDSKNNVSTLNGNLKESTFQCQSSQPFSHIRLTHTGKNTFNNDQLAFAFIEFSGQIF